ncbi:Respiratory-chain NADH dehydrogenase, subunit [Halomonas korlensis]|uniref:Respiratory-chain NADH dehydrogenase, subunit n=2 Tax=Halomonas korlensis TaxID=463301 RepID=A0A1I7H7W6_9GAMM|nr:Respiratory-chain NADH dehydrogenase, subunit [Halomonas korlensis]
MHGEAVLRQLALAPGIERVDSPRHASVLLVAGGIPPYLHEELRRVHDQLPQPCATLWFRSEPLLGLESATRIDELDDLPRALIVLHRELMSGRRGSSPRLLPDQPPNPWEGLGDFGQGGEGMMGGTPYGRPMAMNMHDDIRDGLTLDSLTFRLGPFFPALPPGMKAEITLQGDLIQTWSTQLVPYPVSLDAVFLDALQRPVPIAELELARAREHLHRLFHGLRLAGLERLGRQALQLANTLTLDSRVDGLRRRLVRCGFFRLSLSGRGRLTEEQARKIGGFAARATGLDDDLRSEDAHYRRLGFTPVTQAAGDTRARWQQTLAEIEQSLVLAKQAVGQDLHTSETGSVETPHGPWTDRRPEDASRLLGDLLPGLEWGEALATIASLDLAAVSEWPLEAWAAAPRVASHEARRA